MNNESQHDLWFKALKKEHNLTIWGIPLKVFDFTTSTTPEILEKEFETDHLKLKDLNFKDGDIILDCGANIGVLSILLGKKFPNTQIIAVECMPHNIENLKINLEVNGVKNVIVVPYALAGKTGQVTIYQNPVNSGAASAYHTESLYPGFTVDAVTLDELLSKIVLHQVTFLKMDIEAMEYEVLNNFTRWDRINHLALEVHKKLGMSELEEEAFVKLIENGMVGRTYTLV